MSHFTQREWKYIRYAIRTRLAMDEDRIKMRSRYGPLIHPNSIQEDIAVGQTLSSLMSKPETRGIFITRDPSTITVQVTVTHEENQDD